MGRRMRASVGGSGTRVAERQWVKPSRVGLMRGGSAGRIGTASDPPSMKLVKRSTPPCRELARWSSRRGARPLDGDEDVEGAEARIRSATSGGDPCMVRRKLAGDDLAARRARSCSTKRDTAPSRSERASRPVAARYATRRDQGTGHPTSSHSTRHTITAARR